MSPDIAKTVWGDTVEFAEKANDRATAFYSYEWTSMPNKLSYMNARIECSQQQSRCAKCLPSRSF
jgi:hypothetical protein